MLLVGFIISCAPPVGSLQLVQATLINVQPLEVNSRNMDTSETWITDEFEQSSEDVWSSSTGILVNPNDREREALCIGVELASTIEDIVFSSVPEQLASTLSKRQAWQSVEALAKDKLDCLSRQEKAQAWISAPAEGVELNMAPAYEQRQAPDSDLTKFLSQDHDDTPTFPADVSSQPIDHTSLIPSRASKKLHAARQQSRDTRFRLQNTSDLSSYSSLLDSFFGTKINAGQLFPAPAPGTSIEEPLPSDQGGDALNPIQQESGCQIADQMLDAMSQNDFSEMQLGAPGQGQRILRSAQPIEPAHALQPLGLAAAAFSQWTGRASKHRKAPSSVLSRFLASGRDSRGGICRDHQLLLDMQEELLADVEDNTQVLRLRRGRPSERGMSCVYCVLRRKKV